MPAHASSSMKPSLKIFLCALVVVVITGGVVFVVRHLRHTEEPSALAEAMPEPAKEEIRTHEVVDGDTITSILQEFGYSYQDGLDLVEASKDIYDFTSIRLGKPFRQVSLEGVTLRVEYDINSEEMVIVHVNETPWRIERLPIPYDIETAEAKATIHGSLFGAGLNAGLSEAGVLSLAEVFAWNIDFATQVQDGDEFKVIYEKRTRFGESAGEGRVLAASFTNSGETYRAFWFAPEGKDGGYYDEEGNSLVRQFLKAPLTFSRITSGFTYARFHPVLNKNTPHRAIDYAAPIGTPVLATADGTIIFAGWNTVGYGNFVNIKHNSTYQTNYAHLSKILVKNGEHVKQGEVIGLVGSTGFSTGPHLHYEMKINGELVNPLEVQLPAGASIGEEDRAAFDELVERYEGV